MGGNILESLILTPYLVGSRTGLHPLWVLLAILVGGALHGILGIILTIPISTIGAACWKIIRRCYLRSDFYQHGFSKDMSSNDI
jgi:predicted PurR-regulated permease PerM